MIGEHIQMFADHKGQSLKFCDNLTYLRVYAGSTVSCGGAGEAYLLQSAWVKCLLRGRRPLHFIAVAGSL